MAGALEDLRVVELRQGIAAAYCGMLLGDLGASVVIVQDGALAEDPDPPSAARLYLDRNKYTVLLVDLTKSPGPQVLEALVTWADVVVDQLLPDTRSRLGLDPQRWCQALPRLIYAIISPFGRSGPEAGRLGSDLIVQARSGFMSITGFPEDPYTRSGTSLSEYYTGVATGIAILAALRHRDRTGEGQVIDMALMDTLLTTMEGIPDDYFRTGEVRPRIGNTSFPGYGFTRAADAYVATAIPGLNIWPRFCAVIGRPDLAERPQFTSAEEEKRWGAVVEEALSAYCASRTRAEIIEHLVEHGVPAAPVNNLEEAVQDPVLRERGMLVEVEDPQRGQITITGSPLHMTETPGQAGRAAPFPGRDSAHVLREFLGWSSERVRALIEQGIIGGRP